MSAESKRFLALLEQRIALLGSLAQALTSARKSIGAFDINSLETHIASQQHLCAQITALDSEIDVLQRHCSAAMTPPAPKLSNLVPQDSSMREALERLHAVQSSVKQLNDAHQALLQRSRRTVGALLNSYRSFAATYADPAARQTSLGDMV